MDRKENETRWGLWFALAAVSVTGLWYGSYKFMWASYCIDHIGVMGDLFGAVNALFSGLAFAGLLITILMQSKELKLQRDEMEDTREVFKQQTFENTFFQLLRTQQSIIDTMDLITPSSGVVKASGRDCFKTMYNNLKTHISVTPEFTTVEIANTAYTAMYELHQGDLSHYFRHLYHIIKFIDESNIKDKKKNTSIVRAQLSSYELVLLFYNCLQTFDHDEINKFKPLVERYQLLANLDHSLILNMKHFLEYDEEKAFGRKVYFELSDLINPKGEKE